MSDNAPNEPDAAETVGTEDQPARISNFLAEHPLATAGAAIAAGAVIGMMLPRWRVTSAAGSTIARTATKAAKAIAAAETARTLLSGITAATGSVRAGAQRLADHVPSADTVRSGAKHVLERAVETAHKAGEKVATTARRSTESGED